MELLVSLDLFWLLAFIATGGLSQPDAGWRLRLCDHEHLHGVGVWLGREEDRLDSLDDPFAHLDGFHGSGWFGIPWRGVLRSYSALLSWSIAERPPDNA